MKEKKKIVNRQLSIVNWIGLVLVSVKRRNEVERPERRCLISMFPTKYSYYKLIHINIHRFQSIFITFFSDVWSLIPYNRKDSQN